MWELKSPGRVKLIIGILAADKRSLEAATDALGEKFGAFDFSSDVWPFTQTDYYREQTGTNILRQFMSIERTISPGRLAKMKHKTNKIEQMLAKIVPPEDKEWTEYQSCFQMVVRKIYAGEELTKKERERIEAASQADHPQVKRVARAMETAYGQPTEDNPTTD